MDVPGSGNNLVDRWEKEQEELKVKRLPCGCKGRCSCDDDDEKGL